MMESIVTDPWTHFRRFTAARIALGRSGGSLPTSELLRFSMAHAMARDAVHSQLDVARLKRDLEPVGLPVWEVGSDVKDRMGYLIRPDLGRRLSEDSATRLAGMSAGLAASEVCIVVADGLSATAAQRHASAVVSELVSRLRAKGVPVAPLVIATMARVAIMDEIGLLLKAKLALILLGERPGLGTPDSLGAYLEFGPSRGLSDARRNCVSNIRPEGLPIIPAAETLAYLITQALGRRLSGVELKDDRELGGAASAMLPPTA